jgi:hypothetical protein
MMESEDDNNIIIRWNHIDEEQWRLLTCFWGRHDWLETKKLVWSVCSPEALRLTFEDGSLKSVHLIMPTTWFTPGDGYKGYGMTKDARKFIKEYCDEVEDEEYPYVYEWKCK